MPVGAPGVEADVALPLDIEGPRSGGAPNRVRVTRIQRLGVRPSHVREVRARLVHVDLVVGGRRGGHCGSKRQPSSTQQHRSCRRDPPAHLTHDFHNHPSGNRPCAKDMTRP